VGTINATVDLESSAESDISGGLSKSQVQEVINRSRAQIRSCYQKQLVLRPQLQGRILYSWIIKPSGEVSEVEIKSSTLPSKEVKTCIQQAIRSMIYPVSAAKTTTRVLYPFYLAPY
jgi:hypothetical protein